jgi:hypothetical protein
MRHTPTFAPADIPQQRGVRVRIEGSRCANGAPTQGADFVTVVAVCGVPVGDLPETALARQQTADSIGTAVEIVPGNMQRHPRGTWKAVLADPTTHPLHGTRRSVGPMMGGRTLDMQTLHATGILGALLRINAVGCAEVPLHDRYEQQTAP